MSSKAKGRVGVLKSDLSVSFTDGFLRVDCKNNLDFWLMLDPLTLSVKGRGMRFPPKFLVQKLDRGFRIDDENNPSFWIEL